MEQNLEVVEEEEQKRQEIKEGAGGGEGKGGTGEEIEEETMYEEGRRKTFLGDKLDECRRVILEGKVCMGRAVN